MDERELIYDWNKAPGGGRFDWTRARVDLNDETLRDGLQSPSVRDPSLEVKRRLLHLMADLGIVAADIGLPGAGPRVVEQVRVLAGEIRDQKLPVFPNCAARTVIADVEPIVRVAQEVGIPIEAATFIGSSPIRQYAEDWTLDHILRSTEEAVSYAVKHGLPVMYVTEDTTRAKPEALKALYGAAIDCGATRICLADTVGHATPDGVKALVTFVKREIVKQNDVKIDWHGRRDRGLGLINCLAGIEAGVDRVHATALGVGERVGNAEMDLLIVNLKLLGAHGHDIAKLPEYCRLVADAVGVPIPVNYPVLGADAFRTGTGVHAAAIIKAKKKGHAWLADPRAATQAGVKAYDDRDGRYSPPALAPRLAALKSLAGSLEEAAADEREDEIDRTALLNEIRVVLHRFERERPQAKSPAFWLNHLLGGLHFLLGRGDRSDEERARALVGRLEDVPRLLDDARVALAEPVRVFVETALRINAGGVGLVRGIAAALPDAPPGPGDAPREAVGQAAEAMTAFDRDLERWLETASEEFALGEDDFNFHLHYEHALRDTAPELWRYGLHLKEEVEADLGRRAARLEGGKRWQDVADRLRGDHPPAAGLVEAYAREMVRARDFVAERGLAPIPDAPLDVVPTPAFMRPVIPFAAYDSPGAYSTDRTGWFYVTVPDQRLSAETRERILRDHCRFELPATALHEGYPGHHLQLVHAQAQPSHVRKNIWTPLTVEGWALYCEDMMGEEGFYASEEELLFQRVHLLWRAMRILLDVGLHTRGMTFHQAVTQLVEQLHVDPANAEAEVRRYCAEPAYPLCYAVGRRELLKLRDDYRASSGGDFTLRRFHDAILQYGGLPVTLIRWGLGLDE